MAHNILFQDSIYRCSFENSWFYTPCKVNGFVDKIFKSGCGESKVMHVFYWEILSDCPSRTLKNGRWKFPFPHTDTNTSSFQTSYFSRSDGQDVCLIVISVYSCLVTPWWCLLFFFLTCSCYESSVLKFIFFFLDFKIIHLWVSLLLCVSHVYPYFSFLIL